MDKPLYDQGCKEEAEEYFSHNPNLEKVGFVMLGEEELKNIEDGISVHINEDDVTIVDNPDYNHNIFERDMKELENAGVLEIVELPE